LLWQLFEEISSCPHAIALHLVVVLERTQDSLAHGHKHSRKQGGTVVVVVVGEAVHQVGQRPCSLNSDSHGGGGEAVGDGKLAVQEKILILRINTT
jgi:hypothetical protein